MKILIASDSFKGTNTSIRVASLIEEGIRKVVSDVDVVKIPVADGGEGTVEAILTAAGGNEKFSTVNDPLMRPKKAFWGIHGDTAIIEMAEASGLPILSEDEKNPLLTTTFGTGEIIKEALEAGLRKFLIGLGGSATNDGGTGVASALGYRFLDKAGNELPQGGGAMKDLASIDISEVDTRLKECEIIIASDVSNPLLGPEGATYTYGKQKGADPERQEILEAALANLADITEKTLGRDYRNEGGAGAAGGLGFGLLAFCGAEVKSGINTILDFIELDKKIAKVDLVITGEGKIDGQSLYGKVPIGIADRCRPAGKPLLCIVGDIGGNVDKAYDLGINSIMSTVNRAMPLSEALAQGSELLVDAAERAMRMILIGKQLL